MLETQKKYIEYLDTLQSLLKKGGILDEQIEPLHINDTKDAIAKVEMLIPVVGAFSSGKSSLLNSFLGKEYLPVAITPETSLATELRYVTDEQQQRIEAIKDDNAFDQYEINQIEEVSKKASSYKFMRLYLHNNHLKEIEPLILVDMPGFHSPLDLHNRAILEYLNKGIHYIMLISVEDGTITKSMARKLQDITSFGRDISFFLSKSNLRSPEEVNSVREELIEDIEEILDIKKEVIPIDDNGGESLNKILKAIDPENIFTSVYKDEIKEKFYSAINIINTIISSLKRDKYENETAIENLSKSLESIVKQRDRLINEIKSKYSELSINQIVEEVGSDVSSSIDELVHVAITQGEASLQTTLSDIVRSSLLRHVQIFLHDISEEMVDSFSFELKNINISEDISSITLSDEVINEITGHIRSLLTKIGRFLSDKAGEGKNIYRTITSIIAITTNIVSPIFEILIVFLPDILNGFFKNWQRKSQEENIRNQLLTTIIPKIKLKIRADLPKVLHLEIEKMVKDISNEFESKIKEQKSTIEASQYKYKVNIKDIQKNLEQYNILLDNLRKIVNNI